MAGQVDIFIKPNSNTSIGKQILDLAPGLTQEQLAVRMNAAIAVGAQGLCIGVRRTETPERIIVKVPHNSLSK